MSVLQRLAHNLHDDHTWQIALPNGRRPARLVCQCGTRRPITTPDEQDKCFCRRPECVGWQKYVLLHAEVHDGHPTDADIELDEALHTAYQELLDKIRAAGPPPTMREILARFQDRTEGAE
jgi:hypothetical protein